VRCLRLSTRGVDEVGMCRAEISGELVQSAVSNNDAGWGVWDAVFSIEVLDRGAAATRVTLAKNFLQVALQKFDNSIVHGSIPCVREHRADFAARIALLLMEISVPVPRGDHAFSLLAICTTCRP
jgi:hypothetical protein